MGDQSVSVHPSSFLPVHKLFFQLSVTECTVKLVVVPNLEGRGRG